ncbi:MAG: GNAT family N-acetyltransferase [Alphaproteobacteria bacterium]|nr:MAG: GNAT family N-acetyltransferase [Alphaproteobacteria bacterium]
MVAIHGQLEYRIALPVDVAECIEIRAVTRENAIPAERLASMGITNESWSESVRNGSLPGVVCMAEGRIAGYCFGERESGEILVLALLPEYEGKGIGRKLLGAVSSALVQQGHHRLFLGCSSDPTSRSFGFYRHLGWQSTNTYDANGDEVLEFFPTASGDA